MSNAPNPFTDNPSQPAQPSVAPNPNTQSRVAEAEMTFDHPPTPAPPVPVVRNAPFTSLPFSADNRRSKIQRQPDPPGFVRPGNVFKSASADPESAPTFDAIRKERERIELETQQTEIEFQQMQQEQLASFAVSKQTANPSQP